MRAMSLERWLREDGGAAAVPVPPAMADAASARLRDASRVLEFGCGDADLLRQIVDRDAAFASWTGIDVSESRVVQLRDRFRGERFRFECADCADWRSPGAYDLILALGLAEHVFPSMAPLLAKWRGLLAPGGAVAADFPVYDEAMTVARSRFVNEPAPHYVRTYARWEIERMFADAGLRIGSAEQAGGRFLVLAEAQ